MSDRDPSRERTELDAGAKLFFASCPDPEYERCLAREVVDGVHYLYFEDVQTIGALRLGIPSPMSYPQLVLVVGADGMPERMIRLECSLFGTQMLGVLERDGRHLNFGPRSRSAATAFMKEAIALDQRLRAQQPNS